jgi:signal transduction histidine kinase
MRRLSRERRLVLAVAVSFGLTVLAFVASRVATEVASRRVEKRAESIGHNALIATEALNGARTNLNRITFAMNSLRLGDRSDGYVERVADSIEGSRRETAASWTAYASIPFYPGERALVESVAPDVARAQFAADDVSARLRRRDGQGALRVVDEHGLPAMKRADDGLERLIHFNRGEAKEAVATILASGRPWGLLPEILGALFAIAAAYFGVRLLMQYLRWARERSGELEHFAGRVAHDIRSPLGSASLALEIAQRGKAFDPKTRELLGRVSRTMQRIAQLVDGLMVFATSGGYIVPGRPDAAKTDANEVLGGVVEDLQLEAEAKSIAIELEAPKPALIVACSEGAFISMVNNLASNAIKFMGEATLRRIKISVCRVADDVETSVVDTGPGIAPELCDRIFEPYVRGRSDVPGFGLGLATVRRLADAFGGTVGVERRPEGGSRFWFRLPIWREAPERRAWKAFRPLRTA